MNKPWYEQPLLAFDLETTGQDPDTARIVTFAIGFVAPNATPYLHHVVVNPGVSIPEEATKVHGITTEQAQEQGIAPPDALLVLTSMMSIAHNKNRPLVAFNARYDLTVTHRELHRHGLITEADILEDILVIDPLVIDRHYDRYRRGSRTLQSVATHYGITITDWHTADADAEAAAAIAFALPTHHPALTPTPAELHAQQATWAAQQAASLQKHLRESGKDPTAVVDGHWPVTP